MIYSLGNSQSFPLTFSDSNQLFLGYDGCIPTIVPDPSDATNSVMQVIGGGQFYDTAQRSLSANLNLADDANNTITFRIKPVADYGTRNHLLKFEGGVGGPATTELGFTTTGTAWQTVSLNFGTGLGNYSLVVLFADFANNLTGTYLIDDFAGGTNITPPPPLPTPSGPAPVPTLAASEVVSIYGETYPNTYQYSFGTATDVNLASTGVNNALKLNFAVAGFGAGYTQTNVSSMQFVHFDYWTSNATTFNLYLISNSPVVEKIYTVTNPVLNTWTSVNIPMSYFTNIGFNPLTWFQYKFDVASAIPGTVYFDNIYFTSNSLGTTQFKDSKIAMYPNPAKDNLNINAINNIENVAVYNLLGQEVLNQNPKTNTVTLDISNLQNGVYIVKTLIDGKIASSKFVKE